MSPSDSRLPWPGVGRLSPVLQVGLVVLAIHAVWIACYFAAGHEIRDFIKLGPNWVTSSDRSDVIKLDPTYDYPSNHDANQPGGGFDGQYYYFIAIDPAHARYYTDEPAYRYGRILYPMAARALAGGQVDTVPYAMLLINWLSIGAGAAAIAAWLRRRGATPWLGLLYGLYPGLLIALQRDLTEALAYGLVALAIYMFDFGGRRGVLLAGVAFGLAALTREATSLFPLLYGASILAGRPNAAPTPDRPSRIRRAAAFWCLSLLPLAIWTAVVWSWLGPAHIGANDLDWPFVGLFGHPWSLSRQPVELVFVAVPALLACVAVTPILRRHLNGRLEAATLLMNVLFVVVLASDVIWSASSYTTMSRAATGIVIAALLCMPYLRAARERGSRIALGVALGVWMAMAPVVLVYGFTQLQV